MLVVRLICTDPECADLMEEVVGDLAGLDALACPCGCTLCVVGIAEWRPLSRR